MNGVPVDTRTDELQIMYQNSIAFSLSIILQTQSEFDKITSEEIENDICSERQVVGLCYALEWFQRALFFIVMQNKLRVRRIHINRELSNALDKPLRSHKKTMEITERIDVLLDMKERANGAY